MRYLLLALFLFMSSHLLMAQAVAQLQFIHNLPDKSIDIYINNQLYVNDLVFRHGTSYLFSPSGNLSIGIAPANSQSHNDAIQSFTIELEKLKSYNLMISGKDIFHPELFIYDGAKPFSATRTTTGIVFANGSMDVPEMDFVTLGFSLFNDISYGAFSDFVSIPPINFEIQLTNNDQSVIYLAHNLDLSFWKGRTAFIFTSGYADGRYPSLGTYVVLSNGASFPLEKVELESPLNFTKVQMVNNAIGKNIDIYVDSMLWKNDLVFRQGTSFVDFPADREVAIGLAPYNSRSYEDVVESYTFNFNVNDAHILLINGVVQDTILQTSISQSPPVKIEAPDRGDIAITLAHGSTNLEEVNFKINRVSVSNRLAYGAIETAINITAGATTITLEEINQDYKVDFDFWKGKSACIFTSGEADNFQLRVILSNGASFPIQVEANQVNRFDEPIEWQQQSDELALRLPSHLKEPVHISIIDIKGRVHYNKSHQSTYSVANVPMNGLPAGIYFIHFHAKQYRQAAKIYWHLP